MRGASWRDFCQLRALELASTDWVAGVFGGVVRTVSFAKSSQERDPAMCIEHGLFLLLAVTIGKCYISRLRLAATVRSLI
jgi:hypothetical protein